MSFLSRFTDAIRAVLAPSKAPARHTGPTRPGSAPPRPGSAPSGTTPASPGQSGSSATVEVDPRRVGKVRMTYSPARDGAPDPGEVVWTWVPFEERDGRGKDRPVLVVAAEPAGTFLAVQLTSKEHQGADFVPIGSGNWDSSGRPSWVNVDRVFRVHAAGMRRETAGLPKASYTAVATRLRQRYGWG
ncbi:type II toxin-antitoxin system PemK/MazF family toxin [Nakamurella sp.]|uniref:type II toxin-antitoxin system PemK/MazF family toxin n=1 Tax=Nakamurella sp. TaxID=1869182 RepID=UPI0037849FF9